MPERITTIVLAFQCIVTLVAGQQKEKATLIVGLNAQYGYIIPHSEELKEISSSAPWGMTADVSKLLYSDRSWSNCNCYSKLGLSFAYYNYSNPAELGNSYNLILFAEPFLGYKKKVHATLRAGMGATYLNQVYDEVTNPANLFYSSPISFILILQLKLNYRLSDHNTVYLTANYNHISNGAVSKPNKGMNFPTLGVGYEYTIRPVPLVEKQYEEDPRQSRLYKYARIFWNIRTIPETVEDSEKRDIMIGLEAGLMRRLSRVNGLLSGFEFSYDGLFNEEIKRNDMNYNPYLFSLHLGHFFMFGKFTFTQQLAWYAYKSYPFNDHDFFQRYAILWQFGQWINCGFSLKTHGHVAEYMDVRMGIVF